MLYPAELRDHNATVFFEASAKKNATIMLPCSSKLQRRRTRPVYYKQKKSTFVDSFVGVAGFEPATSCSQSRRDNRATLHPDDSSFLRPIHLGKKEYKLFRQLQFLITKRTKKPLLLKSGAKVSLKSFSPNNFDIKSSLHESLLLRHLLL